MLKNTLLKILAIGYFSMFLIFILGFFSIGDFPTNTFFVFNAIFHQYVLAVPVICLIFTAICWYISQSYTKKKQEPVVSEKEVNDTRSARSDQYDRRNDPVNGFAKYFTDKLSIKNNSMISKLNHNHLGSNFSTYFGQGNKNIFLPSRVRKLNGFEQYFSDKNSSSCEYDTVADSIVGGSCRSQDYPSISRQLEEPRRDRRTEDSLNNKHFNSTHNTKHTHITNHVNNATKSNSSNIKWKLPRMELLNITPRRDTALKQHNPKVIENVLSNFGVNAKVTNISVGPVITRYELSPNPGTKISKITNLADDISLALASREIRIEAPIPGKAAIGIEIPRENPVTVFFREVIDSEQFASVQSKLKVALGKNITDTTVVAELNKMPHLLVAGATGSGKSVFINCLITSLLFNTTPDETKLLLIDPKVVELSQFNGIPHLLTPVVTDPKKASKYLKYIVDEMENRYELFASEGIRDIDSFNQISDRKSLPYIVVIIDELADLMMASGHEVEEVICRLAQKARAAGIHLVIATQRPSVNVITGLIKANIPSRISFAVSSQIDSRTILDAGGAEKLLGNGDMLYSPIGLSKPLRIHGCYINDNEVRNVVEHWKDQGTDYVFTEQHIQECVYEEKMSDDRFLEAGKLVITSEIASVSFLQRRMKVGYARAARLMDMLQEAGVVGIPDGNKPRDILITLDDFNSNFV